MSLIVALSLSNPTYALLVKCGAVLGLNVILKAPLICYYRLKRRSMLNREDAVHFCWACLSRFNDNTHATSRKTTGIELIN